MEPVETTLDFLKMARQKAYRQGPPDRYIDGWTEEQWMDKAYHWHGGTKIYHSYEDYCDD